ncbi:MAG: hypothetical protein JWO82_2067, partial [Akkermansiaceae bacterium]|nr:hypothetical protein [Akkermansiaceae bacterium]
TYVINPVSNVLAGLSVSASSGNFTLENSGGLGVLTDGLYGTLNNDGGPTATHPALATFGGLGGTGTTLTYTLSTATILSSIVIYGGWNDAGRDQAKYTVQGSTDGGLNYFNIGNVDFNPAIGNGVQSATRITFTDNAGNLAGGVALTNIKLNADSSVENGYAGLAEVAAYAAVPEASTSALLGACGALALLRRRRSA